MSSFSCNANSWPYIKTFLSNQTMLVIYYMFYTLCARPPYRGSQISIHEALSIINSVVSGKHFGLMELHTTDPDQSFFFLIRMRILQENHPTRTGSTTNVMHI